MADSGAETHFHYISSSTRQTAASGNKQEKYFRFISSRPALEGFYRGIVSSMRRSVLSSPTWRACAFSAQRWIHSIIFQLSYSWPGRKIGRCWEATRAPIQGPKPRRGVLHGIPFHSQSKSRDGIHAANPGGLGAEPTKRNSFAMIRPFHHRLCHASIRTLL
jgi:hypothetical protein